MTIDDLVLINAYIIRINLPLNALGFVFRDAPCARVFLWRYPCRTFRTRRHPKP